MIGCCEGEVRDCCLKSYWLIYFSNMLWDHIPDANFSGVKENAAVLMRHPVVM